MTDFLDFPMCCLDIYMEHLAGLAAMNIWLYKAGVELQCILVGEMCLLSINGVEQPRNVLTLVFANELPSLPEEGSLSCT